MCVFVSVCVSVLCVCMPVCVRACVCLRVCLCVCVCLRVLSLVCQSGHDRENMHAGREMQRGLRNKSQRLKQNALTASFVRESIGAGLR